MFKRIAHVCLNTRDLKQSIAYYTKLGCTVKFTFTRKGADAGAYLEMAPEQYIEIFENPDLGPVVNNGFAHFCLQTDDIDTVMGNLTAAGILFTPKRLGCDNTLQIWLTDPDGNRFEIHQYTGKSAQLTGGAAIEADW
ncbi:MAG: VOC family protein [Chitinispirillaceae bacterium]|nr:VOC family protein [Chitinispirillaceae bacterium]